MVKIISTNTIPEIDRYRSTGQETYSVFCVNPQQKTCGVDQISQRSGWTFEEYTGKVFKFMLGEEYGRVEPAQLRDYLESQAAQELQEQVCNSWYEEFDGRNMHGHLDETAEAAVEELLCGIADFEKREMVIWGLDELLDSVSEMGITDRTTDDELNEIFQTLCSSVEDADSLIVFDSRILDRMTEWRDELRERLEPFSGNNDGQANVG